MNINLLQEILIIAIFNSVITCAFIQETKEMFKTSKWIKPYSMVVNMIVGVLFSISFTSLNLPLSLWVGLISFVGADAIYKTFEGKLKSFKDLVPEKEDTIVIPRGDK